MKIKVHRSFTEENCEEIIFDAYKFSYLMVDAEELKEAVLCTVTHMLQSNNGCFFSISINGVKIAYGVFSYGVDNPKFRRLYYFAVDTEHRRQGIGQEALELAIKTEVEHGCIVVSHPKLRPFYEKIGFTYHSPVQDIISEITLVFFDPSTKSIQSCYDQEAYLVEIQQSAAFDIFGKLEQDIKDSCPELYLGT
jgi:GNAT superfamily N-acetyltransferase